jgi:uncharacterized protein DUF4304
MEIKLFKKVLNKVFWGEDFAKKGSYYYRDGEECICIIGIQKSNFSNGYYINLGFVLKGLTQVTDKLKDVDGDIRARFAHISEGKEADLFDLEKLSDQDEPIIRKSIIKNIENIVSPALEPNGIKNLLTRRPVLLYQTKLAAKKFLGIS